MLRSAILAVLAFGLSRDIRANLLTTTYLYRFTRSTAMLTRKMINDQPTRATANLSVAEVQDWPGRMKVAHELRCSDARVGFLTKAGRLRVIVIAGRRLYDPESVQEIKRADLAKRDMITAPHAESDLRANSRAAV